MKDKALKEIPCGQELFFPITVALETHNKKGIIFPSHWHEHIEFLYVRSGKGIIECDQVPYNVKQGDLIVVNSGELHCGYGVTEEISYYCIIVAPELIHSSMPDICDVKYISPIKRNLILFNNRIGNDNDISECIRLIVSEHENRRIGFELSIKALVYRMLVILIRDHALTMLPPTGSARRKREMERLIDVFEYIENNHSRSITVEELAKMLNVSISRFSHLFREAAAASVTEYINSVRIRRAADLLGSTDMNITQAAMASGYNDVNYFTRQFKKHMGISPSAFRSGRF
jgi:AraC-like DNA-binding protein